MTASKTEILLIRRSNHFHICALSPSAHVNFLGKLSNSLFLSCPFHEESLQDVKTCEEKCGRKNGTERLSFSGPYTHYTGSVQPPLQNSKQGDASFLKIFSAVSYCIRSELPGRPSKALVRDQNHATIATTFLFKNKRRNVLDCR